mmetsp:Transcript_85012/g.225767  ORF Transcript_85012/g.225767 Transcript_85012/m.225767 type:complete len:228 (-) Transcript_85012:345-1028(-)
MPTWRSPLALQGAGVANRRHCRSRGRQPEFCSWAPAVQQLSADTRRALRSPSQLSKPPRAGRSSTRAAEEPRSSAEQAQLDARAGGDGNEGVGDEQAVAPDGEALTVSVSSTVPASSVVDASVSPADSSSSSEISARARLAPPTPTGCGAARRSFARQCSYSSAVTFTRQSKSCRSSASRPLSSRLLTPPTRAYHELGQFVSSVNFTAKTRLVSSSRWTVRLFSTKS